jgi:hypothetical protein
MSETLVARATGARVTARAEASQPGVIGVVPGSERRLRARLFDALELAYPVRFEPGENAADTRFAGIVAFGEAGAAPAADDRAMPHLVYAGEERAAGAGRPLRLGEDETLAQPLRRAQLTERHGAGASVTPVAAGDTVLATLDGSPAWVQTPGGRQTVALAPAELAPGEALRNRLKPGRCLAMVALAQFIRAVAADRLWQLPPLRAAFVIDDPNLRGPGYGCLDYDQLLASARGHGYHVSMAMVPLDARRGGDHPGAVELFRAGAAHLSLCIHGNNHDGPELGRPRSETEARPVVAQAVQRMRSFERRTGIPVDRVMVAPHERMSEGTVAALRTYGFDAFSGAQPYPWIADSPDLDWLTRPADAGPLPGWGSAELMPGGFPLLMRMDFGHSREELVIRAFLGQPAIVYGHHDVFRHGTEVLESFAADINRLGAARWSSLAGIATAAVELRHRAASLDVRMLGRRVAVDVPPGTTDVHIRAGAVALSERHSLRARDESGAETVLGVSPDVTLPISTPGRLELALDTMLSPDSVPAPPRRLRPVARRVVTRWRDRPRGPHAGTER